MNICGVYSSTKCYMLIPTLSLLATVSNLTLQDCLPGDKSHGPLFLKSCKVLSWRLGFECLIPDDISATQDQDLAYVLPDGRKAST